MNPFLHLQLLRLDVERWERDTGMTVEGVVRVPACEFDHPSDWAEGVALREELAEATEAATFAAHAASRSASS